MTRTTAMALFLTVATTIALLVHRYLWVRLVRDPGLPAPWRHMVTVALAMLCGLLVVGPIAARTVGGSVARFGAAGAFTWLGMMFLFLVALAGADVVRWLVWLSLRAMGDAQQVGGGLDAAIDPERRIFFQRALSGGAAAGALITGAAGLRSATRTPAIKRIEITLSRLPKALDGFRIVQISDLHVSATIRRPYVEEVVKIANACRPDLVALTGDLMDGSVDTLRDDIAPLADLSSRHGSHFCTGNHEYYSGVEPWLTELRRLGINVLRNERVGIGGPDVDDGFDLAGVDDHHAARFGHGHGADLPKALAGRDPTRALILLAHQPAAVHEASLMDVDLMLSGHTHGGQIWPFGYLVGLVQPYVAGLHTHHASANGEGTQIYVSCGTGYWGPPMRIGAPQEVTLITLRHRPPSA